MKWLSILYHAYKPSRTAGHSKLLLLLDTPNDKMDEVLKLLSSSFEIILQKKRKKRSLTANSYAWVLCDKIAKKIGSTKVDVYRQAISTVGVFTNALVSSKAANRFRQVWENNGIGWITDVLSDDGYVSEIVMYYGSSSYDSEQMSKLIDWLVGEAEELGIDTLPPSQKDLLLDEWEQHGNKEGKTH